MASDSESSQPGKKLKLESNHEWKKIIDVPHNKHTIFGPIRNDTIRHAKRTIYDEGQYRLVATLTFMFDKEEDQEEDHQVEVKLEASKPPEELSYSLNIKKKSVSPGGTWINVIHYNQKKLDTADWKNNEVKSKFGTGHFYQSDQVALFDFRFSFIKPKELYIEGPLFSQTISSLFLDETSSDIKIICGDEEFPCHKFVLCSRSDVFKAMLEGENYKEGQDGILEINDTKPQIMKTFLKYMYSDTFDTKAIECDLLYLANKYNVPRLVSECAVGLSFNITVDNFIEVLKAAYLINNELLFNAALNKIKKKEIILYKEEWNGLKNELRGLGDKVAECLMFEDDE